MTSGGVKRIAMAWATAVLLGLAWLLSWRHQSVVEAHVETLVADGVVLVEDLDQAAAERDEAMRALAKETARRERAELDRAAAASALLAERVNAYARTIHAAGFALELRDLASASSLLADTPEDLRGFEHEHLTARAAALAQGLPRHASLVTTLAAAGSADRVATAGYDDAVMLHALGAEAVSGPHAMEDAVLALALDGAGRRLAVSLDNDRVRVFEWAGDALPDALAGARTMEIADRTWSIGMDDAGHRMVLGTDGGLVSVHVVATLAPIEALQAPAAVQAVAISDDGRRVAAGDEDGTLHVFTVGAVADAQVVEAHDAWIAAIAISPDGSLLATGAGDGEVAVWSTEAGTLRLLGHVEESGGVLGLDFGPEGDELYLGTGDGVVSVRDARTLAERDRLTLSGRVERVAAIPGGRVAFLAEEDHGFVWDRAAPPPRSTFALDGGAIHGVAMGAGVLAAGSADGGVRVLGGTDEAWRTFDDHEAIVRAVAIRSDGSAIASGARDGTLSVRRGVGFADRIVLPARSGAIDEVAFVDDGVLAVLMSDGAVAHLDVETGEVLAELAGPSTGVFAAALDPDGRASAFASAGGTLRVFDPRSGERRAALRLSDLGRAMRMEIDSGGRLMALSISGAATRLVRTDAEPADATIARLPLPRGGYVDGLAFAPDGRRLAIGSSDGQVRVVETGGGRELVAFQTAVGGVRAIAFSADGTRLLVGGAEGRLEVWE